LHDLRKGLAQTGIVQDGGAFALAYLKSFGFNPGDTK